jgi:hypothetical protein
MTPPTWSAASPSTTRPSVPCSLTPTLPIGSPAPRSPASAGRSASCAPAPPAGSRSPGTPTPVGSPYLAGPASACSAANPRRRLRVDVPRRGRPEHFGGRGAAFIREVGHQPLPQGRQRGHYRGGALHEVPGLLGQFGPRAGDRGRSSSAMVDIAAGSSRISAATQSCQSNLERSPNESLTGHRTRLAGCRTPGPTQTCAH